MQMKFSDGQSEFSWVFTFAILGYSRNSWKLDARENIVFYSNSLKACWLNNDEHKSHMLMMLLRCHTDQSEHIC